VVPVEVKEDGTLSITWKNGDCSATLDADIKTKSFKITYTEDGVAKTF
jgi:hypothetical protein